jgi:hypothetical protein
MNKNSNIQILSQITKELIHEATNQYPIDLGTWAIKKSDIEEFKDELSETVSELKAFELDREEFPTIKPNFIELEIKTNAKDKKKVIELLKDFDSFELEKFHLVNLEEKVKRINSALSTYTKKKFFVKNKNENAFSKENILKIIKHVGAENIVVRETNKGEAKYKFTLDNVTIYVKSSEENATATASYKEIKN